MRNHRSSVWTRRLVVVLISASASCRPSSETLPNATAPAASHAGAVPTATAPHDHTPVEPAAPRDPEVRACEPIRAAGSLDAWIDAIAGHDDPGRTRLAALARCVDEGIGDGSIPFERIYPRLGELRPSLREALADPAWQPPRGTRPPLAELAVRWLALWADPEDDDLVAPWLERQRLLVPGGRTHVGPTAEEAAASWVHDHLARERASAGGAMPPSSLHLVARAPSGDRALFEHVVSYAHWGYSQRLVVRGEGDGFHVHLVFDHEHWHFDEPEP